ncbi:MAG: NTP transferase domain-containing protein [Bacteroidota bacterium]|jgi:molybdopterin-guanine dinucleotide biosynthesis protein A/nucleoside-triphosphatase THEP1
MSKVVILSGAVQSGKTTALLNHFSPKSNIGGFICPDVNGQRMIYILNERRVVPFQIVNKENEISIGKFTFDKNVFNKACDSLVDKSTLDNEFVIVDEVGPLELKEQGYFHSLKILLENWTNKREGTLILVVREHLVNEVISKFNLKNTSIIKKEDLNFELNVDNNLHALILAGGESSRMKADKYLLKYDGEEQYKRLHAIFNEMGLPVFLSCNEKQYYNENVFIDKIIDHSDFADAGPLTGILSAFEKLQSDLMVVGCDYPLLSIFQLDVLKQFARYGFDEVAFVKRDRPDNVEPLICYLSFQSLTQLKKFYSGGGRSLNKYLQQVNPLMIELSDDTFLKSFDTPEDYHFYKLL